MKLRDYCKSKSAYIISLLIIELIVIGTLNISKISIVLIVFIGVCIAILFVIPLILEYINKYHFYKTLERKSIQLDKKTLLLELMDEPEFLEGKIFYETMEIVNKSMNDEIAIYKSQSEEYMEYINLWIHEIKTPISVAKLIGSNNKTKTTNSMLEELDKIEKFVEQVLYYSKSFTANQDFNVSLHNLDDIVSSSIKENAKILISQKIKIEKSLLDYNIYTDSKWMKFILNQLINNSLQFMDKDEKILKFYISQTNDTIILHIQDNGMGIAEKDIGKVFLKGYVGENGRLVGKSTGFGLYICKKLCDDLYIGFGIESVKDEYTSIKLGFPKARCKR